MRKLRTWVYYISFWSIGFLGFTQKTQPAGTQKEVLLDSLPVKEKTPLSLRFGIDYSVSHAHNFLMIIVALSLLGIYVFAKNYFSPLNSEMKKPQNNPNR